MILKRIKTRPLLPKETWTALSVFSIRRKYQLSIYKKGKNTGITHRSSYTKRFDILQLTSLYTIVDDINAYDIRIGNPYLKNSINHSVNLNTNFNTENPKSLYSINSQINGAYNHVIAIRLRTASSMISPAKGSPITSMQIKQ